MKAKKILTALLLTALVLLTAGCSLSDRISTTASADDLSNISSVCELATLKCYFHNVVRIETEASGWLKVFNSGYKKIWYEYSGIVEIGIDPGLVTISQPDENGVITIAIPDAEILSIDLDETSISEPLVETGFLTSVTTEEQTLALAAAQADMEETASKNSTLLSQAKERAKEVIEGYVNNIAELTGASYTIQWVDA